ncbi:hypothetical protein [Embleya scabrispora]|uniref:hypothetical protein n=1 Tax=Embleya scabrispora TaxID=159449 RepID=UPI00039A3B3E|nr:hypothetical protein [Embleya scabrispora]MYS82683.1 hypothetical protein [Streptomyces sp. SID5474]
MRDRRDVDPEKLRRLDDAIEKAGAGWYLPREPHDSYLTEVYEHPDRGDLYDALDNPDGAKVTVLREFPSSGSGPVWFKVLPAGLDVDDIGARRLVGTPAQVHDWYTDYRQFLIDTGWRIAESTSINVEVIEPARLVS